MTLRLQTFALLSFAALMPATSRADPALVAPNLLLPYPRTARVIDYRPTINATGTRVVFERQLPDPATGTYNKTTNLYIADLGGPPARPLVGSLQGTARADWCWRQDAPAIDGPIAFSTANGVYTTPPRANGTPRFVGNGAAWIYPTWFPGCGSLAVDAGRAIPYGPDPHDTPTTTNPGPATLKVDAVTGGVQKPLSGQTLWAGFPSVNPRDPRLIAFAGQQFSFPGYDQDKNYIYVADNSSTPPRVAPLDKAASAPGYNPAYQGRAPTWSPDGRWIAFESNRTCADTALLAIFIEDGLGRRPATQVTPCRFNAQHAKWYRFPVRGRILLITSVLLYPSYAGTDPLLSQARGIASLDVTAFIGR